jgi:hypothetical protein
MAEADSVAEAAELLRSCETEEARASAAVRTFDQLRDEREASIADRNRRMAELGVTGEVSDPPGAVERVRREVAALVEKLKAVETAGERLGLTLAQAGEQARRGEVQRQADELRHQVAVIEEDSV